MHFAYRQRPGDLLIFMALGILLWGWLSSRFGRKRSWTALNLTLLLVILAAIAHATLLWGREPGPRRALLEPLQTFRLARRYPELYREMFMNVLLFFPFGLAVSQLLPRKMGAAARMALTAVLGALLSMGVEGAQYYWGLGVAETDDVLCNTLGGAMGALCLGTEALFRKGKEEKRT